MRRRAERQAATHHRIVEAAVELHTTLGPARTTLSAIARKAGVQRLTVYRHFPDERALLGACSAHYRAAHPLPDPARWAELADPVARLRAGLAEVFEYHRRTGRQRAVIIRDLAIMPQLREFAAPDLERWREIRRVLVSAWSVRGRRCARLAAAVALAVDLQTWRSLVDQGGLGHQEAIDILVAATRAAVEGRVGLKRAT